MTIELIRDFLRVLQSGPVAHASFTGPDLDVGQLGPHELGELAPTWVRARVGDDVPQSALSLAFKLETRMRSVRPRLRLDRLVETLEIVRAAVLQRPPGERPTTWALETTGLLVAGCDEALTADVRVCIEEVLEAVAEAEIERRSQAVWALALATRVQFREAIWQRVEQLNEGPLHAAELAAMREMPLSGALTLAAHSSWLHAKTDDELAPRGAHPLSAIPTYARFCENAFDAAAARAVAVQSGEIPYNSDRAFTPSEGQVLGRVLRVGLDLDATWVDTRLRALWLGVTLAPDGGKTAPSQSVAIALGRAVEEIPTARAVAVMREVVGSSRHAGVKKKLTGLLRTAERRLLSTPDFLLRLPPDAPLSKSMRTAVAHSVEQLFLRNEWFALDEWKERFAQRAETWAVTAALVWEIEGTGEDSFTAMPIRHGGNLVWHLDGGSTAQPRAGQRASLWHPTRTDRLSRAAWRDRVVASRIVQPFAQVFREIYEVAPDERDASETGLFEDHWVASSPLMGVARSQGWFIRDGGLERVAGAWRFRFAFDRVLHPGYALRAKTGRLTVESRGDDRRRPRFCDVDAVVLSEILRSVDLLTSVGALAYDPQEFAHEMAPHQGSDRVWPKSEVVGQSAHMRREVIQRLFANDPAVVVGDRAVEFGGYRIHLGTARVTRDGEAVELEESKPGAKVIWMPHKDEVLSKIVRSVAMLRDGR